MPSRFRFLPRVCAAVIACGFALVASGCGGNPQIAMRTALDGSPETGVALVGTTDVKKFKEHPTTTPVDMPGTAVAATQQPGAQGYNGAPAMTIGAMPTIRMENAPPAGSSTITALSSLEPPISSIYGAAGPPVLPPSPEPSGAPIPSVTMPVATKQPPPAVIPPRVEEPGTNLPGVEPLPDVIEPPPRRVEMPRKGDAIVPPGSVTIMMPSDVPAPVSPVSDEPPAVSSVNRAVELPDNPAADTGLPISIQRAGPNPAFSPATSDLPASIKAAGPMVSPFVNPAERFANTPTTGSESDRATGIDVGVPDELPKVLPRTKAITPEPAPAPAPNSLVPDPSVVIPPVKLGKNGKPLVPKVKDTPDHLPLPGAAPAPGVTATPGVKPETPATIPPSTPAKEIAKTADTVTKDGTAQALDEVKGKADSAKHEALPAATAAVNEAVKPVVEQPSPGKPAVTTGDEVPTATTSAWGLAPGGPAPTSPSPKPVAPTPDTAVTIQPPAPTTGLSPAAEPSKPVNVVVTPDADANPAPITMNRADEPAAPEMMRMTRDDAPASASGPKTEPVSPTPSTEAVREVPRQQEVVVITTKLGRIVIALDDDAAPLTAANFKKLVQEKFYDGTTFHRTVNGVLIQGGDPNSHGEDRTTHGKGGPGYTIVPEIKLEHKRGSVAAARGKDALNPGKVSNGSQFYICVADFPSADGKDTVFGHVVEGMDVVQKISNVPKDAKDNPIERVEITGAVESRDTGPSPRS